MAEIVKSPLVHIGQAAKEYGIKYDALYRLTVIKRAIGYTVIGDRIYIHRESLDSYIQANTFPTLKP